MAFMTYEGLKDSGTFRLDATTKSKIKANPNQIIGKVVTFVANSANDGNPVVGYGTADAIIAGVVTHIDTEETASEEFVVTVNRNSTFDNVPADTTTAPVEGQGVTCNGKGGVQKATDASNAVFLAFDQSGKTSGLIWVL